MSSSSAQGGQLESMLGDLQLDMSKQGVTTKTKGLCAACNQPVVGQVSEIDMLYEIINIVLVKHWGQLFKK